MQLTIGIIGLPNVGKSTLFQALTKKQVEIANYPFATIDPNVGVVAVPDIRLEKLAGLSHSKKVVPAYVEFVDIAGLVKGASTGEGLGNKFLSYIKEVDAIAEVVRAFDDENIIHVEVETDPLRDIGILETELLLKDLEAMEQAVLRLDRETKTGDKKAIEKYEAAKKLLERVKEGKIGIENEHEELAKEIGLLASKPIIYVFNTKGGSFSPPQENSVVLDIKEELELSALSPDEIKELGASPRLGNLVRKCYELLGLLTFFTTGEDETRAWTIKRGSKAPRAGRAIHSDFEEKFIRAQVISYDKFIEAGSLATAREKGWLRMEGKEYMVEEGDVIEFKI